MKREKKITGGSFLVLALYAFGGLGLEALYAFLLEPMIYGTEMAQWTPLQMIIHWVVTCITWGIVCYSLVRSAKKKYDFDIMVKGSKVQWWQWVLVACFAAAALVVSYLDWGGFKMVKEFQSKGLLLFIFQYIYYAVETTLFTLIIVFAQKAFEKWFNKPNFPYGGIVCGLTWGLVHILSKGSVSTGLISMFISFGFGMVYLLLNRDIRKTYVVLFIMFML